MDADTYPQKEVAEFFNQSEAVVPLRVSHDQEPYASRYQVRWTPCLLVFDSDEFRQQRAIGYQSPEELMAWVTLGAGKSRFSAGYWGSAEGFFQEVFTKYPESTSAPQAFYFHAVAQFRQDHNPTHLKTLHHKLSSDYPDSIWVERSSPYDKL